LQFSKEKNPKVKVELVELQQRRKEELKRNDGDGARAKRRKRKGKALPALPQPTMRILEEKGMKLRTKGLRAE